MAIIYYPQSTTVNQRTVSGSAFTEVDLSVVPNVIFFFNTQSQLDYATGSVYPYTTSYCATASWALNSIPSPSSSWSDTSSWAINVINGGTTITTASTYQITASQAVSASWSSHSLSASWAPYTDTGTTLYTASTYEITSSQAISASWAPDLYPQIEQLSASWASASLSSSYAQTASWVPDLYPQTEQVSASWASASLSSSYSDFAKSSSYTQTASWVPDLYPQTEQISSSWASASLSSSYGDFAKSSSYSDFSKSSSYSDFTNSSSYAQSASWVPNLYPQSEQASASWASASLSSSWSDSSSYAGYASSTNTAITTSWANNSVTASFSLTTSFVTVENLHTRIAPIAGNMPYAPTSESVVIGFNGVGQFASQSRGTVMIGYGAGQAAHDCGPPGGNGGSVLIGYKAGIFARNARGAVLIEPLAGNQNAANGGGNTGLVAIGSSAGGNTAEASNAVLIGPAAAGQGTNVTASNAVVIGSNAAQTSTNITSAVILGVNACASTPTADSVVAIGFRTMQNCLAPSNCTVVGALAGTSLGNSTYVTALGNSAAVNAKTSSYAVFLGTSTDAVNTASNVQKSVAIGYNTKLSSSNICIIGGTGADALKVGMGGITAPVNTLDVLGNISCSYVTASLLGTASWATNSSSSFLSETASSAQWSLSASYADFAKSSSYGDFSQSSSYSDFTNSSSYAQSSSWATTSSASFLSETASSAQWSLSSSYAETSSWANTASSAPSSSNIIVNGGNTVGSDIAIGTSDAYGMSLLTNGVSRLYISSSGPVGIGQPNVAGVDLVVGGAGYVMLTGATRRIVGNSPSSSIKIVGAPSLTNGARIELYGQNTTATSNGCNIGGGLLLLSKCTGSILLGNAIIPDNATANYYLNLTGSNIGIGLNFANPQYTLHSKGHIVPSGSNNYDLGTTTELWNNVYANNVTASLFGTASNAVSSSYAATIGVVTSSYLQRNVVRISGSYTIPNHSDTSIICLHTASIIVTLPTASVVGTLFNIKNGTSGSWNITVSGSEKIDDQTNVIINSPYSSMQVQSDGFQWWII